MLFPNLYGDIGSNEASGLVGGAGAVAGYIYIYIYIHQKYKINLVCLEFIKI